MDCRQVALRYTTKQIQDALNNALLHEDHEEAKELRKALKLSKQGYIKITN